MSQLVLSLFPGIGLLDRAFEEEGFCVVRGPDVLWGGDIRRFNPPADKFDGVIGGPPCQAFSRMAHMVRHNGYEPKFGNLIPEFERCVYEAGPKWFVMENVPDAPIPQIDRYSVHAFCLNNRQLGEKQNRVRRWSFGWHDGRRVMHVKTAVFESMEYESASLSAGSLPALGGSGKPANRRDAQRQTKLPDCIRKQGLPDGFDLPGFTATEKIRAISNGVPMAMGRAIAKAVNKAIRESTP